MSNVVVHKPEPKVSELLDPDEWLAKKYNARPTGDVTVLYEDLPFFYDDLRTAF